MKEYSRVLNHPQYCSRETVQYSTVHPQYVSSETVQRMYSAVPPLCCSSETVQYSTVPPGLSAIVVNLYSLHRSSSCYVTSCVS